MTTKREVTVLKIVTEVSIQSSVFLVISLLPLNKQICYLGFQLYDSYLQLLQRTFQLQYSRLEKADENILALTNKIRDKFYMYMPYTQPAFMV